MPPLAYEQLKIIGHATFAVVIQVHRSDLSFGDREAWLKGFVSELQTVRTGSSHSSCPRSWRNLSAP